MSRKSGRVDSYHQPQGEGYDYEKNTLHYIAESLTKNELQKNRCLLFGGDM